MKTRQIRGKQYVLVVLRVLEWDEKERPSKCVVGYDDSTFDLRDDQVSRKFMTAYVARGHDHSSDERALMRACLNFALAWLLGMKLPLLAHSWEGGKRHLVCITRVPGTGFDEEFDLV